MLRLSEVYASTQGEGPNVGQTTVFVRFAGCNLRCPGWPCDTQHAIDPKLYRSEWMLYDVEELFAFVKRTADVSGARLITLTGGEPFIQHKEDLEQFVDNLIANGYKVEAFTNGTQEYPEWAANDVSMIMDWKLPGSGEDWQNETRWANLQILDESILIHSVKFVCKDHQDLFTAHDIWRSLPEEYQRNFIWYYGKVWETSLIVDRQMVEYVMREKLPWRLNVQLHNYIWPAHERAR